MRLDDIYVGERLFQGAGGLFRQMAGRVRGAALVLPPLRVLVQGVTRRNVTFNRRDCSAADDGEAHERTKAARGQAVDENVSLAAVLAFRIGMADGCYGHQHAATGQYLAHGERIACASQRVGRVQRTRAEHL